MASPSLLRSSVSVKSTLPSNDNGPLRTGAPVPAAASVAPTSIFKFCACTMLGVVNAREKRVAPRRFAEQIVALRVIEFGIESQGSQGRLAGGCQPEEAYRLKHRHQLDRRFLIEGGIRFAVDPLDLNFRGSLNPGRSR